MARVTNLLLADAIREEKSGKFVFLGVYMDVELEEKPSPADVFALVTVDRLEAGEHTLIVKLVDRTAKRAAVGPPITLSPGGKNEKFVNILQIPRFRFPSSGIYSLVAELNGEQIGRNDFKVTFPNNEYDESDEA